jgi:hypothetical protein
MSRKGSGHYKKKQATPTEAPVRNILHRHRGKENGFRMAMDNLLFWRFPDNVVIIRGYLNLSRFYTQEQLSQKIDSLPQETPEKILEEQYRMDIPTSTKVLPQVYNAIKHHIRIPIQAAITRFNEYHSTDRCEKRTIRDDDQNHVIHSKRVPSHKQHDVQQHHLDSNGYRPDLISCFVGLRNNTRLQVYDEYSSKWKEFTYHRGDIFLMRAHKTHRGVNYADGDNSKVFFYIDTPDMAKTHDLHGKVFQVAHSNLQAYYYTIWRDNTDDRLERANATKRTNARKRERAKRNRAAACKRRAGTPTPDDDDAMSTSSSDHDDIAPPEPEPYDCEDLSVEPPPTTIPPDSAKAEKNDSDDTDEEPQISCVPKRKPRQLTSEEYDEWLKEQDEA